MAIIVLLFMSGQQGMLHFLSEIQLLFDKQSIHYLLQNVYNLKSTMNPMI
jgi:hypothetical protein